MFRLLVSNTLSNSSIAFLLSGPGIAVLTCGAVGSSGKKGCSAVAVVSCIIAVAALASGREDVVSVRWVARRVRGARRVVVRRNNVIVIMLGIAEPY